MGTIGHIDTYIPGAGDQQDQDRTATTQAYKAQPNLKNFCVLPWYSQEIDLVSGTQNVCCLLPYRVERHELQQQFLTGERPSACERCWQLEDQGRESRRQIENRFLDYKANRDLVSLAQDAQQGKSNLSLYQITVGTTCNSTCVTCGPIASSAWRQLLSVPRSIQQEISTTETVYEKLLSDIDWSNLLRVNFVGGEPLLIDMTYHILDQLVSAGNTNCRISFVTNGSVTIKSYWQEIIRNFTDISCCVSIDGIGPSFEYLRYPLKWSVLLENLATYQTLFTDIEVSYTLSNLNYHERSSTIQWFQDNNLRYAENYVVNPAWFNYRVMPGHALWAKFVETVRHQDEIKRVDIGQYIPYVANLMTNHAK